MLIITCATNSTLQELKTNQSSGTFSYQDTNDFQSVTSNRYIVWQTCDDILELSEHSLNKNLIDSILKIQFKNTLIIPNGVSIHETQDKIYILVTTLVSAHRLIFDHPTKLYANPSGISSAISTLYHSQTTQKSTADLLVYSIFHHIPTDHVAPENYYQFPNSTLQNTMLGPSTFPFLACCSWINSNLETFFVVSKNTGSLHIVKLPSIHNEFNSDVKVQTIDLKQNSYIGNAMNFLTGIVPSLKSASGAEAAISLLSHSTPDDDLIFALCRDFKIRVLSLKKQECVIVHNIQQNQQQFQSNSSVNYKDSVSSNYSSAQHNRLPISIKLWWHDDDTSRQIPNLVTFTTGSNYNAFTFYETVISSSNSHAHHNSSASPFSPNSLAKTQTEPHLRFLLEVVAPIEQDLIDYFVADNQIWALMQHNDTFNLQYYSIELLNQSQLDLLPFEWIPVIADVNSMPEMGLRSPLSNSREYYLNEIFWRGNFTLSTIAKAISVSNRISIEDDNLKPGNLKIDQLVQKAIKLVDNIIRTQIGESDFEISVEEYTKLELDAWNQLYTFCLGYHNEENKPLSIFVDYNTRIKGIVRQGRVDFIPALSPFDELVDFYFMMCKESASETTLPNGGFSSSSNDPIKLFSQNAFEYRLKTLLAPLEREINGVFASSLEQSLFCLLHGMIAINKTYSEENLLEFEDLLNKLSSCSSKNNLSLSEIARQITEDNLLPEMRPLSESEPELEDFFNKCPMVVEAINFLLQHLDFNFDSNPSEVFKSPYTNASFTEEATRSKMQEGMQYEILPSFSNLLSSRCGLEFVVTSIGRIVNMRFKFCRDLFLFQYGLTDFRLNPRSEFMPKIMPIEADTIPQTVSLLFAFDYLNWVSQIPMISPNIWWSSEEQASAEHNQTKIVNISNLSPPKNAPKSTISNTSSLENSELLSVLEMRDYINLNRIGLLSHESTFYEAYPHSNVLHFFVQFSGGIIAKRLLSYKLAEQHENNFNSASTTNIYSSYLNAVCQLLWPSSVGQFKLSEFLLGVAHYDLLERCIQRLHSWCIHNSYSRYFLKGICYMINGDGQKAIRQFKQSLLGINGEPFLNKVFAKKAKSIVDEFGDETGHEGRLRTHSHHVVDEEIIPNARTVFRYYNKLIQLFKRYSSPDFVIELVEMALTTLDSETDPEYDDHCSSLNSTLFACHLQLNNVKQAYSSMVSNTDPDQRRICLRQFILTLCETGQLALLVSFPYHGLEDYFVSILETKARASSARFFSGKYFHSFENFSSSQYSVASSTASELGANIPINYYYILYSYFMHVSNYRRAAQSMYDYYRRLNQETNAFATSDSVELLQKQADALLIARNCLKLVDANYSWIIKNALKKTDTSPEKESKQKLKRKHGYFTKDASEYNHQDKTIIDIVDDEELLCEYELVNARLRLLQRDPKEYSIAATLLSPEETVILCIGACLYEQAFRISALFSVPLEPIFDGMTSKYVQLLHGAYNTRRLDDEVVLPLFLSEKNDAEGPFSQYSSAMAPNDMQSYNVDLLDIFYENGSNAAKSSFISYSSLSICDRMWHLIMHYLARYETCPQKSSHLMKHVAEKLLSNGIMVPTSLVKIYQKVNCAELIRLLMTYDFLTEATQLSIEYINAFMGHGTEYFDVKHQLYANCPPLYIPMHIFDCLLKILREESEEMKLDKWQNRLAVEDNFDQFNSAVGSVDDYVADERIDYEELYKSLSSRRQKLQDTIVSCSR